MKTCVGRTKDIGRQRGPGAREVCAPRNRDSASGLPKSNTLDQTDEICGNTYNNHDHGATHFHERLSQVMSHFRPEKPLLVQILFLRCIELAIVGVVYQYAMLSMSMPLRSILSMLSGGFIACCSVRARAACVSWRSLLFGTYRAKVIFGCHSVVACELSRRHSETAI